MSNFRTQVNFSSQIKEYPNTDGTLSGSVNVQQYTILGTDYLDLPLGLDNTSTGITATYGPIINGTFTGTTGSTTFYFNDSNMDIAGPYLSAITASNSGLTQHVDAFSITNTIIVDGNSFDIYYSGVSFDMTPTNLDEYSPGEFSGGTFTNVLNYLSGTTYPWWFLKSGSTTWNEVKGRTQTDRLTVIDGANTGYVLTSSNSNGDAVWLPVSGGSFTGGTGTCITDLYVSNIHSCSPLNINPLDEGTVYFGSTSGITIDVLNKRIGVNTSSPNYTFDFNGGNGNTKFYYNDIDPAAQNVVISGNSAVLNSIGATSRLSSYPLTVGMIMGIVGENSTLYPGYGNPLDGFVYASSDVNRLNIVSAPTTTVGTNTDDIRFYAGQFVNTGYGADMHIQGKGVRRGYVGIGTENPSEKLEVSGKTKTTTLQITSGATNGYILTSDSNGNGIWQAPTSGGITIDPFYQVGSGGTFTWDVSGNSTNYEITLTGNSTINLINVQNGQYGTLISTQNSVGYYGITFGTVNGGSITHKVVNGGGGIPILTANPNTTDLLTFTFNGLIMYWSVGNNYT